MKISPDSGKKIYRVKPRAERTVVRPAIAGVEVPDVEIISVVIDYRDLKLRVVTNLGVIDLKDVNVADYTTNKLLKLVKDTYQS
jgi:hypothetical protein